jgi:energy-converting hydrogenase A subunit F
LKSIGSIWNSLANPDRIPRVYAMILAVLILAIFVIPVALDANQLYPRPAPQEQINSQNSLAPYDRGGTPFVQRGTVRSQYPQFEPAIGEITAYLSPIAIGVKDTTFYYGTSIYSSPGGLIDEILYYTRGFDTVLESSILMMAFIIASWIAMNFTMRRRDD